MPHLYASCGCAFGCNPDCGVCPLCGEAIQWETYAEQVIRVGGGA